MVRLCSIKILFAADGGRWDWDINIYCQDCFLNCVEEGKIEFIQI